MKNYFRGGFHVYGAKLKGRVGETYRRKVKKTEACGMSRIIMLCFLTMHEGKGYKINVETVIFALLR